MMKVKKRIKISSYKIIEAKVLEDGSCELTLDYVDDEERLEKSRVEICRNFLYENDFYAVKPSER